MFWSLILPTLMTAVVLPPVALFLIWFGYRKRGGSWRRYLWVPIITLFAFIPTCSGIKLIVDKFRFGEHSYNDHNEIGDFRVKRYLPSVSSNLSVYKTASGFYATYRANESQLVEWMKA